MFLFSIYTVNVYSNRLLTFQTAVESFLLFCRAGWVDLHNLNESIASQPTLPVHKITLVYVAPITMCMHIHTYAHVHSHICMHAHTHMHIHTHSGVASLDLMLGHTLYNRPCLATSMLVHTCIYIWLLSKKCTA